MTMRPLKWAVLVIGCIVVARIDTIAIWYCESRMETLLKVTRDSEQYSGDSMLGTSGLEGLEYMNWLWYFREYGRAKRVLMDCMRSDNLGVADQGLFLFRAAFPEGDLECFKILRTRIDDPRTPPEIRKIFSRILQKELKWLRDSLQATDEERTPDN